MPDPAIVLDPDQAEDLHELLDHAETIAQWLLHAADEILDDLAQTAYPTHFHPRSAVFWLIEDLVHTQHRLHKTLHPDPGTHDHDPGENTSAKPTPQAATTTTTSQRGGLDTSAPIGNQIRPSRRFFERLFPKWKRSQPCSFPPDPTGTSKASKVAATQS